jgi:hypothetical protein
MFSLSSGGNAVGKKFFLLGLVTLLFVCGPLSGKSAADELEKGISRDIQESKATLAKAAVKLQSGTPASAEIAALRSLAESIRASHLLMGERLRQHGEKAAALGAKATARQSLVTDAYVKAIEDYLALIDALPPDGTVTPEAFATLKNLLDRLAPPKKKPLLGALPYKHLGYPAREPAASPSVVPAYRGGTRSVTPADIAASAEAPLSKEITTLAQSLQWNPVLIYEWVKNNVETEWYRGIMKGAEETLRQKSGNDADQAALLVALLRASGFPARYVTGTIEFFPGIDKLKNLIGIDEPLQIATFFQKAGIAFKPVIAGGGIANFQIEHVWVESQIPYSNYRGAVIDDMGKSWLGLDTSIKPAGYTRNSPFEIPASVTDVIREEYLQGLQENLPVEFLQGRVGDYLSVNQPGKGWQDALASRTLNPDVLKIIPASLQFKQIAITGEYAELPVGLRHQLRFTASSNDVELFSLSVDAMRLSNRKVALAYEPESIEDQEIIDSFGGLDNTPSYLVRLRPVLTLEGERLIVAQDGLPMGEDYTLAIDIVTPNGIETVTSSQVVGNLAMIGIVGQKATAVTPISDSDDAATILFKEASGYIDRWNRTEEQLAAFYKVALARPVPTVVTVGGLIDVTNLLGILHGFEWKGVYIDAGYRRVESVGQSDGAETGFMRLSALQGSILENRIFEDNLKVDSISTAKLLQLAAAGGTPLLTLDRSNIDTILPILPFDDMVKRDIANAVNQNLIVSIPQTDIVYQDWQGIGYLKENKETGESGWMLSGMVAGGMTVWSPDKWNISAESRAISDVMRSPYSSPPNPDPLAATNIIKIPDTDRQIGTVGKPLDMLLQVRVTDKASRPVRGATVTFTIRAGRGNFNGGTVVVATTNKQGIATAPVALTLGKQTADNPEYLYTAGNIYPDQYGGNIVDAAITSSGVALTAPFELYGKPGKPIKIEKFLENGVPVLPNNPAGSLLARVVDQYGNPIANIPLAFMALPPVNRNPAAPFPETPRPVSFYLPMACTVAYPLYGDCASSLAINVTTSHIGAVVNAIMGDTVETDHIIQVTTTGLQAAYFTLKSDGFRGKFGGYIPPGLYIRSLQLVNDKGQPLDAAKAGQALAAPLVSELFMLFDDYKISSGGDMMLTGIVKFKPITNGNVIYKPSGGSVSATVNLNNGKYQTTYTTGVLPALNTIEATGEANVSVPMVLNSIYVHAGTFTLPSFVQGTGAIIEAPDPLFKYKYNSSEYSCVPNKGCKLNEAVLTLKSGQQAIFTETLDATNPYLKIIAGLPRSAVYSVYGVDIRQTPGSKVFIDKYGYALNDLKLKYTIAPSDYTAVIADVTLLKDKASFVYIAGDTSGEGTATLARGALLDTKSVYESQVVLNYGGASQIMSGLEPITLARAALVADYDHSRKIEDTDRKRALNEDTYYFWINDDDGKDDTEGTGIPGSGNLNWNRYSVNGTRDLIDFFPVYLDIEELKATYPPSVYTYKLHHATSSLSLVETTLDRDTSGNYLTDITTAKRLAYEKKTMITREGYTVPAKILTGKGVVLVEGWKEAATPLRLVVYDAAGKQMLEAAKLNLSIAGVEQMFRHVNLIQAIDAPNAPSMISGNGGEINRLSDAHFTNKEHFTGFDSQNQDKYFVLLHGVNVNGQAARGWHAEMFKRLYWAGSNAKFVGVSWYSTDGPSWGYYPNVVHAFETAEILGPKLKSVVGNSPVTIMAHSLGNMVVSSYLADHFPLEAAADRLNVTSYLMFDAAVALEAYLGDYTGYGADLNGELNADNTMVHSDWFGYQKRFSASEWYQRFAASDGRNKLTWRNRFSALPENIRYVNFFSSGEDVLATYAGIQPDPSRLGSAIEGLNSWVLQEKWKGRPLGPGGSDYMGWGFNLNDEQYNPYLRGHLDASEANLTITDNNQLIPRPFFQKTAPVRVASILFADGLVSFSTIKPDYNQLMTYAIPALTTATGGWEGASFVKLGAGVDILDMNLKKDDSTWPRREQRWNHSDIKDVAFPFVYQVVNELAIKGALQ